MKYVGKNSISFFMEKILFILMIITVIVLIFLPQVIDYYLKSMYNIEHVWSRAKIVLLIILYPCGVCALIVENQLRRMFKTLVNKDPFTLNNVKSLNTMGICMLVVVVMVLLKIILLNSLMTMVLGLGCVILAMFCFVLADVFKQAVIYKEDNDLTI